MTSKIFLLLWFPLFALQFKIYSVNLSDDTLQMRIVMIESWNSCEIAAKISFVNVFRERKSS